MNQATQVNAWDRLLIGNGEKIVGLNNAVERVKLEQQQLDNELDFILAQQRELEECLAPLEKELGSNGVADPEREHIFQMTENVDTQLKQMSEDLKEIIEHLNETNRTQDTSDPIVQIGRILNAHMNSLQWIDQNTALIATHLEQVSKLHDVHRRENERSFHLTYD
jgi:nuclear pore complex protein Nup62